MYWKEGRKDGVGIIDNRKQKEEGCDLNVTLKEVKRTQCARFCSLTPSTICYMPNPSTSPRFFPQNVPLLAHYHITCLQRMIIPVLLTFFNTFSSLGNFLA